VIASTGLRANASKAAYANLVNGTRMSQCYFGVAVASGDSGQTLAMLGNSGTTVPGTTNLQGGIEGTSFAAPQVAGVAALMLAVNPALSSVDVAYRIMQSASAFPGSGTACSSTNLGNCRCTTSTCGAGVLDAAAALNAALSAPLFSEGVCPAPDVTAESSGGGGGGGASDTGLLAMLAALACWMLGGTVWSRVKARQALARRITTGKP
jgi:serine protease